MECIGAGGHFLLSTLEIGRHGADLTFFTAVSGLQARAAVGLGAQQVCLTTHHTGGFALWPTKASNYSVLASPFGKTGRDILKEFVTSMRKHGLEPCFYVNLPWDAAEWHDSEQHYIDVQGL